MVKKFKAPRTLTECIRLFADPEYAVAFMVAQRWPDGVACPRCGSKLVTYLANARVWKCKAKHASQKFSVKIGTIMEDSPIGLDKWLPAIWLITNAKNGISSYELHRGLGVTQKTAWFMLHRIRLAMQDEGGGKLGGPGNVVEVDETFIGGRARSMNTRQRRSAMSKPNFVKAGPQMGSKAIVLGMLARGGRVRVAHVPDVRRSTLGGHINQQVNRGSQLHTDEHPSYQGFVPPHFFHESVNHAAKEYVRGNVHTNGIENFWSLLKRGLRGTYISVEPFHLFRYLDEQAFRFNERRHPLGDGGRFRTACEQVAGKRLTYRKLIGHAVRHAS